MFHSAAVTLMTAALLLCSCGGKQEYAYSPLPGDLIFIQSGTSEMSGAISSATAHKTAADCDPKERIDGTDGEIVLSDDFDHVGIFAVVEGVPAVIEAAPKKGVVATPLEEFMAEAQENGIVVKRLKDDSIVDIGQCVHRAEGMLGLPYDWSYLPDNGKIYCSELVYESFLDSEGRHIFTARPMNFRDSEGNLPEFWSDLFAGLGERVPEGIPGTNPNDLAREKCLTEVYRSR